MPFFESKAATLYFERAGEGDPLLFVTGTGGDLRVKPNVLDGPLAKAFDLLAYDHRGLGQSSVPEGPYAMADYADDIARLMDHVGWQSAHVLGVSFGGMVAQEFVLRHPERVRRLVLACTSSGGEGGASYPLHKLQEMDPAARTRFMLPVSDTRLSKDWQEKNPERTEELIRQAVDQRAHIPVTEDSKRGAALQLDARSHHDTWQRLTAITAPTFVCGGRYDALASPDNLENLHARIAGSQLKFYEGGHMFMIQDRQAIRDMIAFLKEEPIA